MTDRTDTLPPPDATGVPICDHIDDTPIGSADVYTVATVRRLLAEARAQEREACARLCDQFASNALLINARDPVYGAFADAGHDLAKAIRARGDSNGK